MARSCSPILVCTSRPRVGSCCTVNSFFLMDESVGPADLRCFITIPQPPQYAGRLVRSPAPNVKSRYRFHRTGTFLLTARCLAYNPYPGGGIHFVYSASRCSTFAFFASLRARLDWQSKFRGQLRFRDPRSADPG